MLHGLSVNASRATYQQGFTLVELVLVIVLLGIVAVASTQFIRQGVEIYTDAIGRDTLQQQGRFAVERMSRELRNALPGSVRLGSDATWQCIEFVPVLSASSYLQPVADAEISTLDVVQFNYTEGDLIAIYPIDSDGVYGAPSVLGSLSGVSAASGGEQTLTITSKQFPNESPTRRVYIVDEPVSFCAADNELRRHSGYGIAALQAVPPASGVLLAENIRLSGVDVFEFTAGTLQRSGVIHMDLRFSLDGEWIHFNQEVFVRNTP